MKTHAVTVAIVGGGASGTLTAVHLLRAAREPLTIVWIERDREFGAGAAFAATQDFHLLNVPAGRMSALADQPDHFVRWLAGRAEASDFVPRRLYRDYLAALLEQAERDASAGVTLRRLRSEVVSIDLEADRSRPCLRMDDGSAIKADRVVLALGNAPPSPVLPPSVRGCVRDPWRPVSLDEIPPTNPVLLVGTGLTMIDSVLSLAHAGHPGPFVALSRRGRLPEAHVPSPPAPERLPLCGELPLRELTRIVRDAAARAADWRTVVDGLRPQIQGLWRRLSESDKRRFARHVRPYWDAARHRLAPDVARTIAGLRASGRLVVHAGRLIAVEEDGGSLRATVRARGALANRTLLVSAVVNCTGPADTATANPLLASLVRSGHATVGAAGLGVATGREGALTSASGVPSRVLFTLGPLRRGELWECTAIPEIREQAQSLAATLLARMETGRFLISVKGRRGSRG